MTQIQKQLPSQQPFHWGKALACGGGLMAILSFVGLSWFSFGWFGGITALQILLQPYRDFSGFLFVSFLSLELLAATGVAILSLIAHLKKPIEQDLCLSVALLAGVALLGMIGLYWYLDQNSFLGISRATFLGTGFSAFSFGLVLAFIGALVQWLLMRSSSK